MPVPRSRSAKPRSCLVAVLTAASLATAGCSTILAVKEQQAMGGGGGFYGAFPEMYNLVVNTNHELVGEILNTKTKKKQERLINQSLDLARLSQGLLKGKELSEFIKRSYDMIK